MQKDLSQGLDLEQLGEQVRSSGKPVAFVTDTRHWISQSRQIEGKMDGKRGRTKTDWNS